MRMIWFSGVASAIGIVGTRVGLSQRHISRTSRRERDWWLLLVMSWLPMACWALSQFVVQD